MTGLSGDKRARLLELFDGEAALLAELEGQTELQTRFLAEGDIVNVTAALDKRQVIIEKFDRLHQETEVLMQSYISSPGKDGEIDARRAEIKKKMEMLLRRDNELRAAMMATRDGYSKEIRKLGENRRGLGGYQFSDDGHSGLFDKKM